MNTWRGKSCGVGHGLGS